MNGRMSTNVLSNALERFSHDIREGGYGPQMDTATVDRVLDAFRAEMVANATRTTDEAVAEALKDIEPDQKIQLIKRVRELSGCDLREAKCAVEDALPGALAEKIEKLYVQLYRANAQANWRAVRHPNHSILTQGLRGTEEEPF